jgi:N-acetylglucosaminyl-diphospho-decaprenol L-rhamnosyltransferase
MTPVVSIIIVSWNVRELLAQCLRSVVQDCQAFASDQVEIIVIDNASTDDSVQTVRDQFPHVRLIESGANLGFARANNQALRAGAGRYVLLLNPDTVVKPGAFKSLVDFMDQHAEAGAAGAHILNPDETLQLSCYPAPTLSREMWRLLHLDKFLPYGEYRMGEWDTRTPRQVDAVLGACLIVRRAALDQTGLFDESYFIYSEEIDLCYRIRRQGWRIFWVPQADVIHYGGQSTQQVASEMFLRLYQGKIIYFRKHYGAWRARLYKLILLVVSLVRLIAGPLAFLEPATQRERHLKLAGNYYRLVASLGKM